VYWFIQNFYWAIQISTITTSNDYVMYFDTNKKQTSYSWIMEPGKIDVFDRMETTLRNVVERWVTCKYTGELLRKTFERYFRERLWWPWMQSTWKLEGACRCNWNQTNRFTMQNCWNGVGAFDAIDKREPSSEIEASNIPFVLTRNFNIFSGKTSV